MFIKISIIAYGICMLVLAVLCILRGVLGDSCTDACDSQYSGNIVQICGTDLETHNVPWSALDDRCYFNCGVSTYYAGSCECPNNCFTELGKGSCSSGKCHCKDGWTGEDCSLVDCKFNLCSNNGICVSSVDTNNKVGIDYCMCNSGYTSTDCSSQVPELPSAPWGELFGSEYGGDDDYDDQHPLFNKSALTTVYITMSDTDYQSALMPINCETSEYARADLVLITGDEVLKVTDIGVRIKGSSTRKDQKKGWSISIDEFIDQEIFGVKKFGLKSGCEENSLDAFVKSMMYVDMARAVGAPVHRASYARLYINNKYVGLYFLHEDIGKRFMKSRFDEDDGSGDFMKFDGFHFAYLGDNATLYEGDVEQNMGTSDWSSFFNILEFLNVSTDQELYSDLGSMLAIQNFVGFMVVESFLLSNDNMQYGNNFGMYQRSKSPQKWEIVQYDFDNSFYFDETGEPVMSTDIVKFWDGPGAWPKFNVLANRFLAIPEFYENYISHFDEFLSTLFAQDSPQQPVDRYLTSAEFIYNSIAQDKTFAVNMNSTPEQFKQSVALSVKRLGDRYRDVKQQLEQLLSKF